MSLPQIDPGSTAGPAIRVMIVDDAVVVRGLMSRWLSEESGIEIVGTFRNGREAVDNVLKLKPDVAVLDIDMPELDGGDLSALLYGDDKTRYIPLLFLSALVPTKDSKRGEVGGRPAIAKSAPIEDLLARIESLLA